jgi:dTDP-4-dehydrorhamnose reductase
MNFKYDHCDLLPLGVKRIVITGAKGMLGQAFQDVLKRQVPMAAMLALGKTDLDVRSSDQVLGIEDFKPDLILHCAAIVNADYCEEHPDEARAVKVGGARNIVELALRTGAKVFYPQSFLIYDSQDVPITEVTPPNPLSVYGRLKLEAEQIVSEALPESLVVRMAGFFGGRGIDKNFVGKFVPHIAKLIKTGVQSIEVGDRIWQPTYTNDLAYNTLLLLANDRSGVYCMASHGQASFFDMACEITKLLAIDEHFSITPASSTKVSINEKANRPKTVIMENRRLDGEGLERQRKWQTSLAEYLDQSYYRSMFT